MARRNPSVKTTMTLDVETLEAIDALAESFEDFVSRGEVIDMAFAYLLEDEDRLVGAFGPETEGEDEGGEPNGGDEMNEGKDE